MAADLRNQYWVFGPAVTDSKGNYLLSWIPAGIYNVRIINLSGYRPTSELVVLAGVPTKGIDFVEEANMTAKIEGKVTDDKGNDLPDATVEAVPDRGGTSSGTTDQFGKYTIDKLWAGKYTVRVVGPASDKYFPVRVEDLKDNEIKTVDFSPLGKIIGRVTDENGNALSPATVEAKGAGATHSSITNSDGTYIIEPLPPGIYTVSVVGPPARADKYLPAHGVDVSAGRETKGIDFSLDIVKDFLGRLDDARFSIEATISIEEANQAVALFSVVTLMLAGLSRRRVANTEKIDMLGVLNLYYGLQEDSLRDRLTFGNPTRLWQDLEKDLKALAKDLDQLQSDLDFLNREAKRQFNLGLSNDVLGNVQFPVHFKRYVEIGSDPLLSFDLEEADKPGSFVDKTKIAQADDLLRELKSLILQVVRSLSKYGTVATKRANEDWAAFEARALEVLQRVTDERVTPDQDLKNIWSVLADLIGKNRETEVAPYVVLARHGGKLLKYAMDIYQEEFSKGKLDDFSSAHLRELFQNKKVPKDFWTEQIRSQATLTKRYPLPNWG
jgi:protocatechuate 3,4-dioxygenase beta subunit